MIFGKTTTSTSIYSQHLPEEWALKPSTVALLPIQSPTLPSHRTANYINSRALHPGTAHLFRSSGIH